MRRLDPQDTERYERYIAKFNKAIQLRVIGQTIYNQEWQDAKDYLSRAIESRAHMLFYELEVLIPNGHPDFYNKTSFPYDLSGNWGQHTFTGKLAKLRKYLAKNFADKVEGYYPLLEAFEADLKYGVTLLHGLKATIVKGRRPSEDPDVLANRRTLDNTGTCAVCSRNIKMEHGTKMYHHGFDIRDHTRQGTCHGVGYDAVEVSPEGLVAYLKFLRARKDSLDRGIASSFKALVAAGFERIPMDGRSGRATWNPNPFLRSSEESREDFQKRTEPFKALDNMEADRRSTASWIEIYQGRLDTWEPRPLPKDPFTKKA